MVTVFEQVLNPHPSSPVCLAVKAIDHVIITNDKSHCFTAFKYMNKSNIKSFMSQGAQDEDSLMDMKVQ